MGRKEEKREGNERQSKLSKGPAETHAAHPDGFSLPRVPLHPRFLTSSPPFGPLTSAASSKKGTAPNCPRLHPTRPGRGLLRCCRLLAEDQSQAPKLLAGGRRGAHMHGTCPLCLYLQAVGRGAAAALVAMPAGKGRGKKARPQKDPNAPK